MRALRTSTLVAVPVMAVALLWLRPAPVEKIPVATPVTASAHSRIKIYAATNAAKIPPVPTISDDDLLALFADHPVGLIGPPGQQQLIVLDQSPSGAKL